MDSRFPISATQMFPEAASSYRGITIRAPLTVDESDVEHSFSSQRNITTSSYYSGSEIESEGYESGENEVEKDEVKSHLVEHSLRSPDEEFGQESVNVSKNDVFRPFVRNPDGNMYKGSGIVDDSDDGGSFLSDSGDELVKNETFVGNLGDSRPLFAVRDEAIVDVRIPDGKMYKGSSIVDDSDDGGFFLSDSGNKLVKDEKFVAHLGDSRPLVAVMDEAVMDVGMPMAQKLHIPIAQISADSDDDSQISGVSDEDFSGTVRVPSVEILRGIDSTPKVRVVETEGDDKAEKIEMEFVDGLVDSDAVLGSLEEMKDEEDLTDSLVVNEAFDSTLRLEIQESDVVDEENRSEKMDSENEDEIISTVELISLTDCSVSADLVLDKGLDVDEEDTNNSLVVDEAFDSTLGLEIQESEGNRSEKVESENEDEVISTVEPFSSTDCSESADLVLDKGLDVDEDDTNNLLVVDEEFDSTLESGKDGDHLHLGLEIQETDEGNQSEEVGSKNEHEIGTTVDSDPADGLTSVHQCVDISEVPTEARPISPEPLTESTTIHTSDGLFKDSSWSSVIDGGESVSESSESDPETRKEAVKSDGEILSEHSGEIDGEFKEASSETKDKIEQTRANYVRLLCSLGQCPADSKDLYQLITLSDESSFSQEHHLGSVEAATDGLDFSLSILVIGNTGVGKSATINTIFGETKVIVDAFEPSTPRVKEIVGTINGVKLKVFDTPGFRTCSTDQSINRKIFSSIKKAMRKSPPDVILYVDRLDTRTSLHNLKSITSYLGPSMWRKSIIVFTHGASIPTSGYEVFVAQKTRAVRQIISRPIAPVCVVENHPFVETSLHDGERWRSEFLLSCCSMKILSEFKNVPPRKLSSSFLQSDNVVHDVAHDSDQETGAQETSVPPSFRRRSLVASTGWDRRGNADHFPAVVTVRFNKNVAAAFDDRLCVRTRCSDARMAGLWLVPIVRAVFKKMLGED